MFNPKDYLNYAHKDAPNGPRFVGMANEPVPVWAVDVREGNPGINALGLPCHFSDQFLKFEARSTDQPQSPDEVRKMLRFRELWERLGSNQAALDFINMLK